MRDELCEVLSRASDLLCEISARKDLICQLVIGDENSLRATKMQLENWPICLRKARKTLDSVVEVDVPQIANKRQRRRSWDRNALGHDEDNRQDLRLVIE